MNSPAADFGIAPSTRAKLLRAIESVLGIERVWIFGSRAQGTQRPESDIDLAVSISADESHAMLCLSDQVQRVGLMYRVDLVCMQDKLEERFRKLIERDRKLFWEPRRPTTAATTLGAINLKDFQSAALDALAAYIAQLKPYAAQVEQNAQALRAMEGLPESVQREGAGKECAAVAPGHRWQPVRDGADAASRQSKETLRFFRDRGNVLGFLPREDDIEAHWDLLREVPNLDAYGSPWQSAEEARAQKGSIVKSSLGNVMRLLRPMVVIDEGHHAYSENALRTIDGFNPCFLLELSATPRQADHGKGAGKSAGSSGSNILVDVRGTDLDAAEMIKLPIDVEVRQWNDWQSCLAASVQRLDTLQAKATALQTETARYIRPISARCAPSSPSRRCRKAGTAPLPTCCARWWPAAPWAR